MEKFPAVYHANYKLIGQREISYKAEMQTRPVSEPSPPPPRLRPMPGTASTSPCDSSENSLIGACRRGPAVRWPISNYRIPLLSISCKDLGEAVPWTACSLQWHYRLALENTRLAVSSRNRQRAACVRGKIIVACLHTCVFPFACHHRKMCYVQFDSD